MTPLELGTLGVVAAWNLVSYWPMLTAVQPGLRLREAAVANLASTAVANTLPGGGALGVGVTMTMQRSWGIPVAETALAMVVSGVWNNFVKLGLPVVALALLAISGGASTALVVAAADRARRAGRRRSGCSPCCCAASTWRPGSAPPPAASPRRSAGSFRRGRRSRAGTSGRSHFRADIVGLLERRWIRITVTSLVSHLSLFAVLLVALRHVGVSNDEVSWQEVLAAFAFVRLLSAVPITPGGLGLVELGLTAALGIRACPTGRRTRSPPPSCCTAP